MTTRTLQRSHPQLPPVLLVPGLGGSNAQHWQSRWDQKEARFAKVELSGWDNPHRNTWINNLNLAIRNAGRPVVLAAHSLGCLAVAWWAQFEKQEWERQGLPCPVLGALLVAPPEVDFFPLDERIAAFAPTPTVPLPFPSRLIASRNDPWVGFHTAQTLAHRWGSTLVDAGDAGHINADSNLGDWEFGREQLALVSKQEPEHVQMPTGNLGASFNDDPSGILKSGAAGAR